MQLDILTPEEYWHYNYGDEHDDKDIFDKDDSSCVLAIHDGKWYAC